MGSFLITSADLENFKSHATWKGVFDERLTVLVGPNAAGKTSILEAITLAAAGRPLKAAVWEELVRDGQTEARVRVSGVREGALFDSELVISREGRRVLSVDGKTRPLARAAGRTEIVTFLPEDLALSKGPAEIRREAIDSIGERLSSAYAKIRREYARIVRQRNRLLKDRASEACLEPWDERMVKVGAALAIQRGRLLARLAPSAAEAHRRAGGKEALTFSAELSWLSDSASPEDVFAEGRDRAEENLAAALERAKPKERERGLSLVGPHRDDIALLLDGKLARSYASQGQHRTIALAWKMAEARAVEHVTGRRPVILLDDVMSELDLSRREALSKELLTGFQAIVTATDSGYFSDAILKTAAVVRI